MRSLIQSATKARVSAIRVIVWALVMFNERREGAVAYWAQSIPYICIGECPGMTLGMYWHRRSRNSIGHVPRRASGNEGVDHGRARKCFLCLPSLPLPKAPGSQPCNAKKGQLRSATPTYERSSISSEWAVMNPRHAAFLSHAPRRIPTHSTVAVI